MNERGIIKALIMLVIAFAVLLLVFGVAANFIAPLATPIENSSPMYYSEKTNPLLDFGDSGDYGYYDGRGTGIDSSKTSKYAGKVSLSSGNASWSIQPYEEYVTIENRGNPVNITGWKLENGKGSRPIQNSQNSYVYPSPESAYIGQGTEFLDPSGKFIVGSIILGTNEVAIVTTSGPFSNFPLSIYTNFKENICLGYLQNYPFNPQVEYRCPYATDDSQIRTVTDECYDYIRSLGRCEDPKKTDLEEFEEQTSQCRNFISTRLNYKSCVANNRYSANFPVKQWRVFLGRSHEMWASQRETIKLYDATGLLVDQISY
jgi:hypothetical protein